MIDRPPKASERHFSGGWPQSRGGITSKETASRPACLPSPPGDVLVEKPARGKGPIQDLEGPFKGENRKELGFVKTPSLYIQKTPFPN